MAYFLCSYDNVSFYGGFNKSKIIFEGLFLQKYGCLKNIDNFL